MSDSQSEDIDDIREEKREELEAKLGSPDEPVHVDSRDHLSEVVDSSTVVLVDFYADWCGPCKMVEPIVAGLAAETVATVAKVDVDVHQDIASEFGVQGVPTLVLFADGEQVEEMVGVQDEDTLAGLVEQYA
ncbi:MAG: thioredoxin 1 [Haloarculaceae archaeon]|jgi:thioredoxin 1